MRGLHASLVGAALALSELAIAWNQSAAYPFKSRPDLNPQPIQTTTYNRSLVSHSDGYIFLSPCIAYPSRETLHAVQSGPAVYDLDGTLVWSGFGAAAHYCTFNFQVQDSDGSPHLTFSHGTFTGGDANMGQNVILDSSYRPVATVASGNGRAPPDYHVFQLVPGGTALISIMQPRRFDLRVLSGPVQGYILDGILQEVNLTTGKVLFEWSAADHVPVEQSIHPLASSGISLDNPYSFFHMNSVAKTPSGDYLVSASYTSTIYCISAGDGRILWRFAGLPGLSPSNFTSGAFNFSGQHDVQIVSWNNASAMVSVLDNHADPNSGTAGLPSSGKLVLLNFETWQASLVKQFDAPNSLESPTQGSLQFLSNGNTFIGWGQQPFFTEFASVPFTDPDEPSRGDGTVVLHAQFAPVTGASQQTFSYAVRRCNWTGLPADDPALFLEYDQANNKSTFYTSWNGATEIQTWEFYGGYAGDSFGSVGSSLKTGFETMWIVPGNLAEGLAVAMDGQGKVLGQSPTTMTFFAPDPNAPGQGL